MSDLDSIDLICRARRGALSGDDQRRVDQLLRTSHAAQLEDALLAGFERESAVQRGDDALVARIVTAAVTPGAGPRPGLHRRPWVLVAAAAFLAVGAAGAWQAHRPHRSALSRDPRASDSSPSGAILEGSPQPTSPIEGMPFSISSAAGARVDADRRNLGGGTTAPPSPDKTAMAVEREQRTAGSAAPALFAEANLLRRQGRVKEASALYRDLIAKFPGAREVAPARLALAKLLAGPRPTEALEHYRVVASRAGPLQPEALWGIADLSRRLGQPAEEQDALSELLRRYPDSAYAEAARERLADEHH